MSSVIFMQLNKMLELLCCARQAWVFVIVAAGRQPYLMLEILQHTCFAVVALPKAS
jgi:hypothetical protein